MMTEVQPKTLEEHRRYLYDIVRLKLFFLHLYLTEKEPGADFSHTIRQRVDIYRKTDANPGPHTPKELFFDAPAWKTMEDEAERIFKSYNVNNDRARQHFEDDAFAVFKDSIDRRCERDFLDDSVVANYQCGSLKYDSELYHDGWFGFHITNAVRPHSFYDDPLYLPRCFRALLRVAEVKYRASAIFTNTWLNDSKRWQAQFPSAWMDNMTDRAADVNWTYCWWGQFISARGTLQKKSAEFLREHHDFRYKPRESHCPVDLMKEHIFNILGE